MKLLLDTNVYSAFRRNQPECVQLIRDAEELILSTIVVGELLYGFQRGSKYAANVSALERFVRNPLVRIAPVTMGSAARFGNVSAQLSRAGTPIPTNDVWLAAQTFELGVRLASFDQHFSRVESLPWLDPARS